MDGGGVGCSEASAANSSGGAAANAIIEVVKVRRVIRFAMCERCIRPSSSAKCMITSAYNSYSIAHRLHPTLYGYQQSRGITPLTRASPKGCVCVPSGTTMHKLCCGHKSAVATISLRGRSLAPEQLKSPPQLTPRAPRTSASKQRKDHLTASRLRTAGSVSAIRNFP